MSAAQVKPEQWQIDLIERATYLRGRFIQAYAQCEFLLADLSVKVDARFRYLISDRIKAANSIAEREGAFKQYAQQLLDLTSDLMKFDDLRHGLVHGFLIFTSDRAKNHRLEYRRYYRKAPGFEMELWHFTLPELEQAAEAITQLSQAYVAVFRQIYLEQGLERELSELF